MVYIPLQFYKENMRNYHKSSLHVWLLQQNDNSKLSDLVTQMLITYLLMSRAIAAA